MDHLVLIRYVKICENPIAIVIMSTSTARRNMYKYSVSLMIQMYKLFKITVLCKWPEFKRISESPNISYKRASKIITRLKTLITCRSNVLMKYERQLCKTAVAWNYTEERTVPLLGDWGAHPNTVCALSCKTSLLWVKSGKRKINPLFGTTYEEVLLSRLRLCYSMEYSI